MQVAALLVVWLGLIAALFAQEPVNAPPAPKGRRILAAIGIGKVVGF